MACQPACTHVVGAGEIAAVGAFDLDDARALIGKQAGTIGRGDRLLQGDNKQSVQRAAHDLPLELASFACAVIARLPSAFAAQRFTTPSAPGGVALRLISAPSNRGDTARNANSAIRACG